MAGVELLDLPEELLRQICGHLPCQAALDFILVCRYTCRVCNDWTVWKDVVMQIQSYTHGVPVPLTGSHDGWKRYTIADAQAGRSSEQWGLSELGAWLPQLAVAWHPVVLQRETVFLERLFYLTLNRTSQCPQVDNHIFISGIAESDAEAWNLAQAASFCFAVNRLSYESEQNTFVDHALKLPSWFQELPLVADRNDHNWEAQDKVMIMQHHTMANMTAGSISAWLRSVYIREPPSAFTIPFTQFMKTPPPFASGAVDDFHECHLPTMTDPRFFTSDEWTGTYHTRAPYSWNPVCGPHRDAFEHLPHPAPPSVFPYGRSFEGVVRLHSTGENQGNQYVLVSNNFHTKAALHRLSMRVEKETGQLTISHWHPLRGNRKTTKGVITPFGIVSRLNAVADQWLWLWKVKWTAAQH